MSTTTSNGRHAEAWSQDRRFLDSINDEGSKGQHRANLIDVFRKHLARRFGQ
jgi:hypothetical protein